MIRNITIGSDPEFFIFKEEAPLSSIGIINGTKRNPETIKEGYNVLKDNVLIEGNIPPANTKEEFVDSMKELKAIMAEIVYPNRIVCADSAEFLPVQLDNKEARLFGCAPYFNAWTLGVNSPGGLAELNHRVAGTHIHIGYTYDGDISHDYMALYITRAFDFFVIHPSRMIHNDPVRAKYYGDYGNFRIVPYGVECRSLGGYFSNDQFLEWIYDQTIKTLDYCSYPENIDKLASIKSFSEDNIQEYYDMLNINLKDQLHGVDNYIYHNNAIIKEAV